MFCLYKLKNADTNTCTIRFKNDQRNKKEHQGIEGLAHRCLHALYTHYPLSWTNVFAHVYNSALDVVRQE